MTAIETLKEELLKVQKAQSDCVNEQGYILNHKKYLYYNLIQTARDLKGAIDWLEKLSK